MKESERLVLRHGDALGEVSRLVDVEPAFDREVIGQELQRDDIHDRLETFLRGCYPHQVRPFPSVVGHFVVTLVTQHHEVRFTRTQLLQHLHHLAVARVLSADDHEG